MTLQRADDFLREPRPRGYALGIHAFAKINLGLWVGRTRSDGYHEIRTTYQTVSLADTLYARPARRRVRLRVRVAGLARGRGLPLGAPAGNLVRRAAELLRTARKISTGADLLLVKRIPAGSGVGGGSSDGVAALRLLSRLWGARVSPDEMRALALRLGSDCPFFVSGGRAAARGRGERLAALSIHRLARVVLAFPRRGVPTRTAYRLFTAAKDLTLVRAPRRLSKPLSPRRHRDCARSLMPNLLEEPVCRRFPEVARARELLAFPGVAAVQMSGSGSAVYGVLRPGLRPDRLVPLQLERSIAAVLCRYTRVGSRWCT